MSTLLRYRILRLAVLLLAALAGSACSDGRPTYGDGIASATRSLESACAQPLAELAAELDWLAYEIGDPYISPDAAFPYSQERIVDLARDARNDASECDAELDNQRFRASMHNRPPESGLEPDWP